MASSRIEAWGDGRCLDSTEETVEHRGFRQAAQGIEGDQTLQQQGCIGRSPSEVQHAAIESQTGSSLDHSSNCGVLANKEDSHCSLRDLEEFIDRV